MPIFGLPVSSQEAARITGQQERVEALMSDGYWHTVPELQKALKSKYGQLYSETSISARLRDMRKRGYTVSRERTRAGSNLYQYRAVKDAVDPRPLNRKERAIVEAHLSESYAQDKRHVESSETPAASSVATSPTPCTPERAEAIISALNCTCLIDPLGRCILHNNSNAGQVIPVEEFSEMDSNAARIEAAL
jgi:hypothetical protein